MDTPVRKYQKQKDYQRHKLFRKMKRRRKAAIEQAKDAPMKPLRRKFKIPKFEGGKDDKPNVFQLADGTFVNSHNEPLEVLDYAGVEDPTKWTYVDKKGNRYTPKATRTLTEGEQFTQRQIENEQNTRPFEFTPYIEGANEGAAAASLMMGFPFNMAGSAYYGAKASRDAYNRNYLGAVLNGLGAVTPAGSGILQSAKRLLPKEKTLGQLAKSMFNEAALAVENYRYPLGRPQVPEGYSTLKPQTRTRVGDVEIDNPQLAYRQGDKEIVEDFFKLGEVRTPDESYAAADIVTTKNGFNFDFGSRTFENPMFAQGRLWYGLPERQGDGLLVTAEPLGVARQSSRLMNSKMNGTFDLRYPDVGQSGRRVQLEEGQLSPSNTTAYTWEPRYGYKRILPKDTPTISWADAVKTPQITAENAASMTPTEGSTIASGYSINLQDALDNPAFDFTPTGVPRTWWDIMSKRRPDVALSRWEKLGKDLDVKNPIYTDRAGAKDAKNIFNSDWYQKRLNDRVSNPEEVTSTFNTRIDKTPLLIQDPGTGFGMEAAGKNISKVERGIGLDGKEKVIVDNKILLHPDMIGKTGDYKYFPENYLDDVVKHETLHSSSGTGLALPTEVRANNYKYHMTPKYSRESNPSMYDYMSVDDEQRVRLLKFAELAETKFGGDYNKAFDYVNDHYYTWAKDGISHDVMDLVTNFNKEDVVKSASNILGWLAPILTGATLYGYNSLGQPTDTYKHGKDESTQKMKIPVTTGGAGYIPDNYGQGAIDYIRRRLYNNILPWGYNDMPKRVYNAVIKNKKEENETRDRAIRDDLFATYLQIPKNARHTIEGGKATLTDASYKPKGAVKGKSTYKFSKLTPPAEYGILAYAGQVPGGLNIDGGDYLPIGKNRVVYPNDINAFSELEGLGQFTVGRGYDKKGEYISYYDSWDLGDTNDPYKDKSMGIGKPFNIYDRIYLDDYYGVRQPTHATYLPEVTVYGKKKKGSTFNKGKDENKELPYPLRSSKDYDDNLAYQSGIIRDPKTGHMWSTTQEEYPNERTYLKKPNHPTFNKALWGDLISGYDVYFKNGNTYSAPTFSELMYIKPPFKFKMPKFKHGKDSGIHIDPKNRGKFNALKKRTGKTTEQLTHSKNPLTRKRAIFAQNAKKWKH